MATATVADDQPPPLSPTPGVIAGFILDSQRRRDVNDSDAGICYRLRHQSVSVFGCVRVRMAFFLFIFYFLLILSWIQFLSKVVPPAAKLTL